MAAVRLLCYLIACSYLLLALPNAGQAFVATGSELERLARAGDGAARAWLGGFALFLPLAVLFRRALRFWYTLGHELTHGLTSLLLGGHPHELQASASGRGKVTFAREPALFWLVLLAPYVVNPSYLVPALVPLLRTEARVWGAGAAGLATAFAAITNVLQIRSYQSDIRSAGLLRALLFIAWGNLTALALAVSLAAGGYGQAWRALRLCLTPLLP